MAKIIIMYRTAMLAQGKILLAEKPEDETSLLNLVADFNLGTQIVDEVNQMNSYSVVKE